jgi:hypothetical protein
MTHRRVIYFVAAVLGSSLTASAAFTTWTGAAGNAQWSDPLNWSAGVPGATDIATVASPLTPIVLGGDRALGSLQVSGVVELTGGSIAVDYIDNGNVPNTSGLLKASLRARGSTLSLFGFSAGSTPAGMLPGLSIEGPIEGDGYTLQTGSLVNLLGPVATSSLQMGSGTLTLAGAGTLTNVSHFDLRGKTLQLDNTQSPLSARLNPNADLRNQSFLPGYLTIGGHGSVGVTERVDSVVVDQGAALISLNGAGAPVRLDTTSLSIGATSILGVYADGVTRRFTADTAPAQVGGSGGAERALVRNAMALSSPSSAFESAGPMTYDTALAADGRHVGLRPLRNDEFSPGFANASSNTNVRIDSTIELGGALAVNSLTVDRSSRLTLTQDLTLEGGILWHSAAGASADAPVISGPAKLKSALPLQIFAGVGATDLPVLSIDAQIDAPSLLIAGNGIVRLSANNVLPEGVKLEAGGRLTVAQPQALGTGTLTMARGRLRFEASQTINNPVHYDQGDFTTTSYTASSFGIGIDPGQVVTLNGPLSGGGVLFPTDGGLLRVNGGGSFNGVIGSTLNGPVEINGTYTTLNPSRTLFGTGALYGNATVPLVFRSGRISPGAISDVGQLHIYSLEPEFGVLQKSVLIDLAGSSADRLIIERYVPSLFTFNAQFSLELQVLSNLTPGQTHRIVEILNPTSSKLAFANLPEGSTLTADGYRFRISYLGGDGNDVTLTVLPEPGSLAALGLLGVMCRRSRRK